MKNKVKILVTGGTGYIGSKICNDLLEKNFDVYCLDKKKKINFYSNNIKRISLDLKFKKKLENIFAKFKFDYVIHLAAKKNVIESETYKKNYFLNNVSYTVSLLKLSIKYKVKKFIFMSSAAVYGNLKEINDNSKTKPISYYGKTKLMAEKEIVKISRNQKIKILIIRLFNACAYDQKKLIKYTNTNDGSFFSNLLSLNNKKNVFYIYGSNFNTRDGTALRNFISIEDISKFVLFSLKNLNRSRIMNLCSKQSFTILEILKFYEKFTKNKLKFVFLPSRKNEIPISNPSFKNLKKIGFKCNASSLLDIFRTYKDSFKKL